MLVLHFLGGCLKTNGVKGQEFPGGAPEEIRKLGEEFSHLKIGFRGDLRFYENPNIYEVAELFQEQTQTPQITM